MTDASFTPRRSSPAFASPPLTERELDRAILRNRARHDAAQASWACDTHPGPSVIPLHSARWFTAHDAQHEAETQAEIDAEEHAQRAQRRRENLLVALLVVIALLATVGLYALQHGVDWPALLGLITPWFASTHAGALAGVTA